MDQKWFKLGAKASSFWDPTQPTEEQKSLSVGEVKQLAHTQRVEEVLLKRGLVEVSEDEAKKSLSKKEIETATENKKANAALEAAAAKEVDSANKVAEAKQLLKDAEAKEAQSKKLLDENAALVARVAELEANAAAAKDADKGGKQPTK